MEGWGGVRGREKKRKVRGKRPRRGWGRRKRQRFFLGSFLVRGCFFFFDRRFHLGFQGTQEAKSRIHRPASDCIRADQRRRCERESARGVKRRGTRRAKEAKPTNECSPRLVSLGALRRFRYLSLPLLFLSTDRKSRSIVRSRKDTTGSPHHFPRTAKTILTLMTALGTRR